MLSVPVPSSEVVREGRILQNFMYPRKVGRKLSNIKKVLPIDRPCKKTMYNSLEEAQDMIYYIKENRNGNVANISVLHGIDF